MPVQSNVVRLSTAPKEEVVNCAKAVVTLTVACEAAAKTEVKLSNTSRPSSKDLPKSGQSVRGTTAARSTSKIFF